MNSTIPLDRAIEKLAQVTYTHKMLQSSVLAFLASPNADTIEAMRMAAMVRLEVIEVGAGVSETPHE